MHQVLNNFLPYVTSEKLVQTAFQSLQLVVTDFLPIIPCCYLDNVVDVAAKFGLQKQELNVSLTAIGLLVVLLFTFYYIIIF